MQALVTATKQEEVYYEITKRVLDDEIFEGSVLDIYADLKNDTGGIFDTGDIPDVSNILYLINEEIEYIIKQFCEMSGLEEEDSIKSVAKWDDDMFPVLPRMIEKVLLSHSLPFINSREQLGLASRSNTILACQNVLFPQMIERR